MQSRAFDLIGTSGLAMVALAYWASHQQKVERQEDPPQTVAKQIDMIQSGIRTALDDLSMTKLVEMHGTDAKGNPTSFKVSPEFGLSRVSRIGFMHDGVLRQTGVPMRPQTSGGSVEFFAVSRLGKPLSSGRMTLHARILAMDTA